ncbi:hypothetical protein O6H91_10G042200 [Diphasiastrum complanatum]|uniref:Uncharacterized protein n=1 Tax=Diphasiastrum complanatum TaxID=34168 RepID=A0ACC2CG70_DIPCM|nr:hypothetical protein O6H91_Y386600 [Diphasiastrum complanatum]KAJ7541034.1 hypothetical protein O6H91_10G042200 [Diphasiastrum complanatum]
MGRTKLKEKKLPFASSKVVPAGNDTDSAPVQRKRGRPRKVPKEEPGTEEYKPDAVNNEKEQTSLFEEGKKRGRTKKTDESAEKNGVANGGGSEEPAKPQAVKREGSRRKGEPRRAAGVAGK